jgi:NAD(P)H dehydrogenase (quinone)
MPKSVIDSREDMKAGRAMQHDMPLVTLDDFREAGAIAFGTPTRFGNVSAQLKNQIDQLSSLWLNLIRGSLRISPYAGSLDP